MVGVHVGIVLANIALILHRRTSKNGLSEKAAFVLFVEESKKRNVGVEHNSRPHSYITLAPHNYSKPSTARLLEIVLQPPAWPHMLSQLVYCNDIFIAHFRRDTDGFGSVPWQNCNIVALLKCPSEVKCGNTPVVVCQLTIQFLSMPCWTWPSQVGDWIT